MRVKGSTPTRNRRKKVLKLAKGYFGSKHLLYRTANARINAAVRQYDLSYSKFMHGLKLANINVNRKMLSEIAIHDEKGFKDLVDAAKAQLEK